MVLLSRAPTEHMGLSRNQGHYNAYVEDNFADGDKSAGFSSKKIQPKPGKAVCEIEPEGFLIKCGVHTLLQE